MVYDQPQCNQTTIYDSRIPFLSSYWMCSTWINPSKRAMWHKEGVPGNCNLGNLLALDRGIEIPRRIRAVLAMKCVFLDDAGTNGPPTVPRLAGWGITADAYMKARKPPPVGLTTRALSSIATLATSPVRTSCGQGRSQ